MTSGTPRLSRPGSPSFRRWLRAGFTATGRGLGFCVLAAAGAGLLLALVAPLFLLLFAAGRSRQSSASVAAVPQSASAGGGVITSQGGPGPGQHLILAAVVLLLLTAVWLLLLPRLVLAIRLLARVTRELVADWCGIRIAEPSLPSRAARGGGYFQRLRSLVSDAAAARELLWLVINTCGGWVLAALPAGLIVVAVTTFLGPAGHSHFAFVPPGLTAGHPGHPPAVRDRADRAGRRRGSLAAGGLRDAGPGGARPGRACGAGPAGPAPGRDPFGGY